MDLRDISPEDLIVITDIEYQVVRHKDYFEYYRYSSRPVWKGSVRKGLKDCFSEHIVRTGERFRAFENNQKVYDIQLSATKEVSDLLKIPLGAWRDEQRRYQTSLDCERSKTQEALAKLKTADLELVNLKKQTSSFWSRLKHLWSGYEAKK